MLSIESFEHAIRGIGGWRFVASWLLLVPPLAGVLSGALTSWIVARRNIYINSITAERSKWLEKLRSNVAEHSAILSRNSAIQVINESYSRKNPSVGPDLLKQADHMAGAITDLIRISTLLKLQLNPQGYIDRNIIAMLDAITVFDAQTSILIAAIDDKLILHFQYLLKAEWEKVKYEAGTFWFRRRYEWGRSRRKREYETFASDTGAHAFLTTKLKQLSAIAAKSPS